ncbi:hypothetical protein B0T10DRAFT_500565 [Thelonectria olida]|uniref:Apple domain-containing protein n=1 Tax=Thelonectria olida TaxID=1576542 RepID=A0A9P8VRC5_9HYPO|nr:hypothetical protein B0T10DRAFT_500565 [Thelonectria olida]
MTLAKAATLLAGLAFMGTNAGLCKKDTTTTAPTTTSASQPISTCDSLPSTIKCNMEAKSKGISQMYPIITIEAANAEDCYAACTHEFYTERCVAWVLRPAESTCTLLSHAADVNYYAQEGTGLFVWDRVCLECDGTRTTTSTSPTPTVCPPAGSVCNGEGTWNNPDGLDELDFFSTYYGVSSIAECYEGCTSEKAWGRCRSWSYTPSEEKCLFYKVAVSVAFTPEAGTGVFFRDRKCSECSD